MIVQGGQFGVGGRGRVGVIRRRRQTQLDDSLPGVAPVQGRCLAKPAAGPAGTARTGSATAQLQTLLGQQPDGQRVRNQHHGQRDVEAHDRTDQLVDRVRDLARALHQHRRVVLNGAGEKRENKEKGSN